MLAGSPAVEPQALSSASETAAPPGEDFADAALGLRFPAPGPEWFREAPGGAPGVVAVWVRRKGEETLGLVSISVDTAPKPAGVVDYAKSSFAVLSRPPLSFAIAKKGSLQIGGHEAFEVRFGPADATKRYVQDYVSAKKGAILVFTLQASKTCSPHGELRRRLAGVVAKRLAPAPGRAS